MSFCKFCGAKLEGNEKFCPECGKVVSLDEPPVHVDDACLLWGILSFFIPLVGIVLYFKYAKTRPKSAKGALTGIILQIAIILLCIVCFFVYMANSLSGYY